MPVQVGASKRLAQLAKSSYHGNDDDIDTQILRVVMRAMAPMRSSRSRIVLA